MANFIIPNIRVVSLDLEGNVKSVEQTHNVVTNLALDLFSEALRGTDVSKLEINFLAVGTGAATGGNAPSASDTALVNEVFRKQTTFQAGGTNRMTTITVLGPSDANVAITELGWYGGDATSSSGSGTLLARVAYSRSKTSSESLQVNRQDTFAEG
tara:strand:- start:2308 stop:2775 length:468 start_codon:yes stop_codon:yes gene_type:complete